MNKSSRAEVIRDERLAADLNNELHSILCHAVWPAQYILRSCSCSLALPPPPFRSLSPSLPALLLGRSPSPPLALARPRSFSSSPSLSPSPFLDPSLLTPSRPRPPSETSQKAQNKGSVHTSLHSRGIHVRATKFGRLWRSNPDALSRYVSVRAEKNQGSLRSSLASRPFAAHSNRVPSQLTRIAPLRSPLESRPFAAHSNRVPSQPTRISSLQVRSSLESRPFAAHSNRAPSQLTRIVPLRSPLESRPFKFAAHSNRAPSQLTRIAQYPCVQCSNGTRAAIGLSSAVPDQVCLVEVGA